MDEHKLREIVVSKLQGADIEHVSLLTLRTSIEEEYEVDLKPQKMLIKEIATTFLEELEKMNNEGKDNDEQEEPPAEELATQQYPLNEENDNDLITAVDKQEENGDLNNNEDPIEQTEEEEQINVGVESEDDESEESEDEELIEEQSPRKKRKVSGTLERNEYITRIKSKHLHNSKVELESQTPNHSSQGHCVHERVVEIQAQCTSCHLSYGGESVFLYEVPKGLGSKF